MGKRISVPKAKLGQLVAKWGRASRGDKPDLVYAWGGGGADKSDSRIVSNALEGCDVYRGNNLRQELEDRGYDISTLKLTVEMRRDKCVSAEHTTPTQGDS